MFRPRIIPVLLLKGYGLVKSEKFGNFRYIGDPINAVKIFNDLQADELVFLDILATPQKRCIAPEFVKMVGDEANMPFSVGGGVRTIQQIKELLNAGAEKVILNSVACENPDFVQEASMVFGASTIVVCMDVKKNWFNKLLVWSHGARNATRFNPLEYARLIQERGAGELIVQSIELDGTMQGYDYELIRNIASEIEIPVVALGGAGSTENFLKVVNECYASAVAAGSMFVYHGPRKAVLINFPSTRERQLIFKQ